MTLRARRLISAISLAGWISILLAAGTLTWLGTHGPDAVTLRAGDSPLEPVGVGPKKPLCRTFAVLPAGSTTVRYRLFKAGARAPRVITLQGTGRAPVTLGPIRQQGLVITAPLPRRVTKSQLDTWQLCVTGARPSSELAGSRGVPSLDLLGPDLGSWLQAFPTLVKRATFARGSVIGWASLPLGVALLITGWFLAVRLLPRARRDLPVDRGTILRTAAVSLCFSAAFALTTPLMSGPDEPAHQHQVEFMRANADLPRGSQQAPLAPELSELFAVGQWPAVAMVPGGRPPWTAEQNALLNRRMRIVEHQPTPDPWTTAISQPPGYYGSLAVVDAITGGTVVDHMVLNRLLSALLIAFALAGALVFARAAVPSAGGLIVAGGLIASAFPLLAFVGGIVNPDAALIACASWLLAGFAVSLRHGLTWRRGLWIGLATGLGLLSKITFFAFMPGVILGGLWLAVRALRRDGWKPALAGSASAALPAAAIGGSFYVWAKAEQVGLFVPAAPGAPGPTITLWSWITYIVQSFFGRFGGIDDRFGGSGPDYYIQGFAGNLGWLDYGPPGWVWPLLKVLWIMVIIAALLSVARSIWRRHAAAAEFLLWATFTGGLMAMIAYAGLQQRLMGSPGFEQSRYLLPLLPVAIAGAALAMRLAPRRLQPAVTGTLVLIGLAHGAGLYLITIGRYFG